MATQADEYSGELRHTKSEIAEHTRLINRLQNEIFVVKAQVSCSKGLGKHAVKAALSVCIEKHPDHIQSNMKQLCYTKAYVEC